MTHTAMGFFWSEQYGHRYCVLIMDRSRTEWGRNARGERVRRIYAREYHANTVAALREKARPWQLGRRIAAKCLAHSHPTGHE